jgi:hypothetical protein
VADSTIFPGFFLGGVGAAALLTSLVAYYSLPIVASIKYKPTTQTEL